MSRESTLYFKDIVQAIDAIQNDARDMNYGEFVSNSTTLRSVLYSLMTIGEASTRLDKSTRSQMSEVEWRAIISFRNLVVHEYFGLDSEIVWTIATEWMEPMRVACVKALRYEGA